MYIIPYFYRGRKTSGLNLNKFGYLAENMNIKKQNKEGSKKDFMQKMTGLTGGYILPLISEFIFLCGSSVPEDLSGANSACE